ncbi:MAG: efflux RND transporter permease subunit [Myxococcales bacterium]|nr:efflux RND transporter permease subunit [Myxococcales bacterium]
MSLVEFAVKRWQFTLVVLLGLVALGVQSLSAIPKAEDPTFPVPIFGVVTVLPGATPSDMERLVVDPLEARLDRLDDVKSIKTQIDEGLAVIQVEFTAGVDADRKYDEVLRETSAAKSELPADVAAVEVRKFNAANVNIVQLALVSDTAPYRELERRALDLERRLESTPGVGDVTVTGLPDQEVTVALDIERMVALGVSPVEVSNAIGLEAANIPAGTADGGARQLSVKTSGDYDSVDAIVETPIRVTGEGDALRVGDVAEVTLGDAEATQLTRYNGKRAVFLAAPQKEAQNVFAVRDRVHAELDRWQKDLPASIALERGFDQSKNVAHRLSGFLRDFGLAIGLVLLTLLPLGLRASIVVMVSIPLSLAIGVSLLHAFGFSINQLSIVGFVIALGLLVDDSVVVVENTARWIREGTPPKEAAIRATRQITLSVLGCTATLILAFVPLLFLPGTAGQFIRSMPVAVVVTIAASLLVSLTVVPFLSSRLLVPEEEHGNIVFRGLTWLIGITFRPILKRALAWPKTTVALSLALFGASLLLVGPIGFSLFPKANVPQFLVTVKAPEGASLAETDRAVRFVEAELAKHDDIVNVSATVGRGNPQIYYNLNAPDEKASYGEVFAEVKGYEPAEAAHMFDEIRARLAEYPGAKLELKEFENGPPLDAPIALRVLGSDPVEIEAAARQVEAIVESAKGTRDVNNPARDRRTDVRVLVDRDKAASLGVTQPDVDRSVRLALGGIDAATYRMSGRDESLAIRLVVARDPARVSTIPGGPRPTLEILDRVYVPAAGGAVPLAQVASVVLEPSPTTIRHYSRERTVVVTAQVARGENTDRVTKQILADVAGLELPPGVRVVPAGEIESRQESFGGIGAASLIALFGVLAVLVLEFRTFKSTLIVASVVPMGILGGLVALYVTGNTLSFTATIGFVALMGIEVKNSILLVDFTNQLRAEGMGLDDAIRHAGEVRFVPILLTTLTALGGLVPLALERSPLYSPLAIVLMGGLISSTILARVVTPVLYKLLAPQVEAVAPEERTTPASALPAAA